MATLDHRRVNWIGGIPGILKDAPLASDPIMAGWREKTTRSKEEAQYPVCERPIAFAAKAETAGS